MTEIKATERPWRIERNNPDWISIESEHFHIAHVLGGISGPYDEDETLLANAHCLVTSREMLEKLIEIHAYFIDQVGESEVAEELAILIAKAKGESNG